MGQAVPNSLVTDLASADLVECVSVHVPSDGLTGPAAGCVVPDNAPGVPALIRDGSVAANAGRLVADTAGISVAVYGSIASQVAY